MNLLADTMSPKGRVEIFTCRGKPSLKVFDVVSRGNRIKALEDAGRVPVVYRDHELDFSGCDLLDTQDVMNIIVNKGKDLVINSLTTGFIYPIVRLAVGDRGALPSDPTVPKVAMATQSSLFNEIYRADVDATILSTGTPALHQVKFIKTVSASMIPATAFSNQAMPVINEAGLITADLISGSPLPRPAVVSPAHADSDEELFAIRTFKSVPFDAANDISVTIRYTIFIE